MGTSERNITVSIIIKAYNEEENIASCLKSALNALEGIEGEIILADGLSTDNTVEIAKKFPIKIVQLKDPSHRSCGAGPQLGYQVAKGEFIYILDAGMILEGPFIKKALEELRSRPSLGGVAGLVVEENIDSHISRVRSRRRRESVPGKVNLLAMGGLYRKAAIDSVQYFSNRNLYAFEEMDIGLRLSSAGWGLERLPIVSVHHYGHTENFFVILKKRWKSGYLQGSGQILRSAWGKKHFSHVIERQKHLLLTICLWMCVLASLILYPESILWAIFMLMFVLLLLVLVFRKKSLIYGILSFIHWQVGSTALLMGFFRPGIDPTIRIPYAEIKSTETIPKE